VSRSLAPLDSPALRKQRGAFFTPPAIAEYLAKWGIGGRADAKVLDPTSGEGVFVLAAARQLRALGVADSGLSGQVYGVDLHRASINETQSLLSDEQLDARLLKGDFFSEIAPSQLGGRLPWMDAVVGNPPFVRYQEHRGEVRQRSAAAALAQGVRLTGLASSWAALLVHACGFLKPDGRVAMVVPSELLTVGYAEPIRRWLRKRFSTVHLVLFDQLQFSDAEEQVVLLVAGGSGGCDAFALHQVGDAGDLSALHPFDATPVAPLAEGKWTDMLMPSDRRSLFRRVAGAHFTELASYGQPELGTVTGANKFFALSEATRVQYGLRAEDLVRIVPPGSRHVPGTRFTEADWEQQRFEGARVWLLSPTGRAGAGLRRYVAHGESLGVQEAYKCTIRSPWWRPPVVPVPDLFFTYMSHRFPRLVANEARATFVNSMHGVVLREDAPPVAKEALPLLAFNSLTILGAEILGRSYGGGILKMEPREAASLPVPNQDLLQTAWAELSPRRSQFDAAVRAGAWESVIDEVDTAVLRQGARLRADQVAALRNEALKLRRRRTRRDI